MPYKCPKCKIQIIYEREVCMAEFGKCNQLFCSGCGTTYFVEYYFDECIGKLKKKFYQAEFKQIKSIEYFRDEGYV